jgi:hypothetical protein
MTKEQIKKATTGLRFNTGKPRWSLVHFESMLPLVRVLEFGASKYDDDNWKKGLDSIQILESMIRHCMDLIDAHRSGNEEQKLDKESHINHIGHIMCNAMFYSYFELYKKQHDSKETKGIANGSSR